MGLSTTQGAVRPSQRKPAMKVCVPQWPKGALALTRAPMRARPAKAGHLRRGPGLVKKDQPLDVLAHARLAGCRPFMPRFLHIGALGFGGQKCFF
jgi:hypothetical protein